ncbi:MAG: hypothetical protein F6K09_37105 [Merismopedia sp. SIO2A8]|nr:hypothetical protein [Merismopedia sp. SIO2A8]
MIQQTWLSFGLLFASYSSFSWFLHHSIRDWHVFGVTIAPWMVWAVAIGTAVAEAMMLTTLMDNFRYWLDRWLKSDIGYFTVVVIGAMSVAFAMVWFSLFGYVLALLASETLARLDLQSVGVRRSHAFILLTITSLVGVAVGWLINEVPYCTDPETTCWFSRWS